MLETGRKESERGLQDAPASTDNKRGDSSGYRLSWLRRVYSVLKEEIKACKKESKEMFWVHYGPESGLFFLLGNLIWVFLLALLIGSLVRWLVGRNRTWGPYGPGAFNPPPGPHLHQPPYHSPSALEILQQRYARGEIDAATFDQMRERLEASARPDR